MSGPDFWKDQSAANKVVEALKSLKSDTGPVLEAQKRIRDLAELFEIAGDDHGMLSEIKSGTDAVLADAERMEFMLLFAGEFDANSAILSINSGAGGTESCDWADMLLRMYVRWAQSKSYKVTTTDILPGEEAGIKNATVLIEGQWAYGYLKSESGVHRLVRISPFDSNKRRHTSFASVEVIPELEEGMNVEINPDDLKIDVYRSSGHGGQSVNTTDSAVRITHLPSGLVVACQNERSQYQNKQTALKILKARIYELEREKHEKKLENIAGQKQKIEWGSQIRSYVMHPYSMAKDHRSGYETGNVAAVMNGELDAFMEAYLRMFAAGGTGKAE